VEGDSVQRTGSVPSLKGFAGHHHDESANRRRDGSSEPETPQRGGDEVDVRSDAVAGMQLLRERVLAITRERLALGNVHVQSFAEVVEGESVGEFLSRLLSDQNQLVGQAVDTTVDGNLQRERDAAFEQGVREARELLAAIGGQAAVVVDAVAAEFDRRLAALEGDDA